MSGHVTADYAARTPALTSAHGRLRFVPLWAKAQKKVPVGILVVSHDTCTAYSLPYNSRSTRLHCPFRSRPSESEPTR